MVAKAGVGRLPIWGRRPAMVPPHAYFVASAILHYLGPSFAVLLFSRVGVLGVAWLRIASAAVVLVSWRRPYRLARDRRSLALILGLGTAFALMNSCFYLAISRMPLATVAAIEFLGPIALALLAVTVLRNFVAVVAAAVGVYLLTNARVAGDPLGVGFAFANAVLFTVYIILGHRLAQQRGVNRFTGLAASMAVAVVVVTPIGLPSAAAAFKDPLLLGAGVGVGITSSVLPYVLDQLAMARMSRASYSLFVAILPATATVMGLVVLRQYPSVLDLAGIGLVMLAVGTHRMEPGPRPIGRLSVLRDRRAPSE